MDPAFESCVLECPKIVECEQLDFASSSLTEFPGEIFSYNLRCVTNLNLDHNEIYELPPEIQLLSNLTFLSLVGNNLQDLPDTLCCLSALEVLSLNENALSVLPEGFGDLSKLRVLYLIGNSLAYLPGSVKNLSSLEEAYLDENQLQALPPGLCLLPWLRVVETCSNQLTCLPEDLGLSQSVQVLSASHNQITELPVNFQCLSTLKLLDLSHNKLAALPDTFSSAVVIEKLFVENNELRQVPSWFGCLKSLLELSISDNYISNDVFSDAFCDSSRLVRRIDAGGNFMMSMSANIGKLTRLSHLHIGSTMCELERRNFQNGNWIKQLPDSLCYLAQLRKLNINENQISRFPEQFGSLVSLQWLDAGQNLLEFLPDSFCSLSNLEYLQISKNLLKELPVRIGNLKNLVELRLDSNLLTSVPDSLSEITGLQSLDLFDNKLAEIPRVVFKLKGLKRLDLDQNEFPLKIEEVPKFTPTNRYPHRDPALKDNWRGRSRPDKQTVEVVRFEANVEAVTSEAAEEILFNQRALENAMRRGMSLWRSHKSELTSREVMIRADEKLATKPDADDEWVALSYTTSLSKKALTTPLQPVDPDEEDWDREIEECQQHAQMIKTGRERVTNISSHRDFQDMLNSYPPARQAFSHTANYDSFLRSKSAPHPWVQDLNLKDPLMRKSRFQHCCVHGQFEDA